MTLDPHDPDIAVRMAAFEFLKQQTELHGERLPRGLLAAGFQFHEQRVPLIGPQGIFKPRVLPRYPLTFTTVPPKLHEPAPYEDKLGDDGIICYRYRGTDPNHPDNVGMRDAGRHQIPLIYLYGIVPGVYQPVWPVYIVGDDPQALTFTVQVGDQVGLWAQRAAEGANEWERRYATRAVQTRLHQAGFRERVLHAYGHRCAICQLKHPELLDAAHILSDKHPQGRPIIPNGISLCTLHHATYDQNIVGIRPDYVIEVRDDILKEHDGPTLRYAIQALQGQKLHVPTPVDFKPNREFLEIRYDKFLKAS